jgi:antitoxin component YwqK of YwqJK toxin-antitoxin module
MKKYLYLALVALIFSACQTKQIQVVEDIYENGNPKIVFDYLVKSNDSIPLHEIQYHEDGSKLLEGEYVDGLREGEWLSWFPDGSIWSKGYFSKGKRTGKSWVYHPNGQLYMKGTYENGHKIGLWLVFDEEGNVEAQQEFDGSEYEKP